jgi:hypothetical protein
MTFAESIKMWLAKFLVELGLGICLLILFVVIGMLVTWLRKPKK